MYVVFWYRYFKGGELTGVEEEKNDDRTVFCASTQGICSETTDSWNSEETVGYTYDQLPFM